MTLYVRRISQKWVGKYDLYTFIGDTRAGYDSQEFTDVKHFERFLDSAKNHRAVLNPLIKEEVFTEESEIYLFFVDMEEKKTYIGKVEFGIDMVVL